MLCAVHSHGWYAGGRWPFLLVVCLAVLSLLFGRVAVTTMWSNASSLLLNRGLLAPGGPDAAELESARQALYRAVDAGLEPSVFAERVHQLEVASWLMQSQVDLGRGDTALGDRAKTYATWTEAQFQRTELGPLSQGDWLGAAGPAGEMQLWSLAVYLYGRAWHTATPPSTEACWGYAQALLEQQQAATAQPYLQCAFERAPDNPAVGWLMVRALAQEQHWAEAAQALARLSSAAPTAIETGEAAALAAQIERYASVAVTPDVRTEWQRQARNLLANGSFESGYAPWSMWPEPGSNTTLDGQHAYRGFQSLRVDFDGTQDVNYYQIFQTERVVPGNTYRLTGQIWADGLNRLLALEVTGPNWFGGVAVHDPSLAGWRPVDLTFTPPPNVNQITITVRRYSGTGVISGTAWVDDIMLLPAEGA